MIARLDSHPANSHQPTFRKPIVDTTDKAAKQPVRHDASNGMATYLSRYAEAQELARRNQKQRPNKGPSRNTPARTPICPLFETEAERRLREDREDQARHFAEINAYEREAVKERLKNGFRHHFAMKVGRRHREPFTELGLRSEIFGSVAARYFVSCLPRRGRLRGSMDKGSLAVQARSKLLSLDYPWIEANKKVMSVIRIDCDRVFASPGQCLVELGELVGHKIPCLPHLITGDLLPDGRYSRPHFYFLLPQGHAVWNDPDDKRCRVDIVRLFQAVSLGLTKALLDLGADPCAPTLTLRGKNPLSPYWHTLCPNDTTWPTLSDYAGWVDMSVSREKLVRQAAAAQSEIGIEGSNPYFNGLRKEAFRILREWHFDSDPRGRGERGRIADELHQMLIPLIAESGSGLTEIQQEILVAKIADYAAGAWDVSKVETINKARGRLLHVTERMDTVAKRQAAGATYAAATKAGQALGALVEAYRRLRQEGYPVSQTAVAAAAGVHRRTAIRRWPEVLAAVELDPPLTESACDNRCIDKKAGNAPAKLILQSGIVDHVPGASAKPESTGSRDPSKDNLKTITSGDDSEFSTATPEAIPDIDGHPNSEYPAGSTETAI